jgi:hypothetical protein
MWGPKQKLGDVWWTPCICKECFVLGFSSKVGFCPNPPGPLWKHHWAHFMKEIGNLQTHFFFCANIFKNEKKIKNEN